MQWEHDPSGQSFTGESYHGCGVYEASDGWYCNVVIDGEIFNFGPFVDCDEATKKAEAEFARRSADR